MPNVIISLFIWGILRLAGAPEWSALAVGLLILTLLSVKGSGSDGQ